MSDIASLADVPWIAALAWSLLHFFWQGAVVGVVFAMVRKAIPEHQCNVRYLNGLLTLLALGVLPVATFFIQLTGNPGPTNPLNSINDQVMATVPASGAEAINGVNGVSDSFLPWIVAVWLIGVLLVGLRSWRQWRELIQVARHWAIPDACLQDMMAALASRFGFARHIRVLVSDRIDTPTLIGWVKPLILLPTAVALGFPRQQIELILAHELGHLRRYDHLVNLAQALLETLLFYHPVVHWVAHDVRNEREICCDELVLRVTCGEPRAYAGALAALEELRQPPARLALAASGGILLERVRRILFGSHTKSTRFGMRLWLPPLAMVVALLTAATHMKRSELVAVHMPQPPPALMQAGESTLPPFDIGVIRLDGRFDRVELPDSPAQEKASALISVITAAEEVSAESGSAIVNRQVNLMPTPALPAPDLSPTRQDFVEASVDQAPAVAPRKRPVAIHTVAPEYPDSARGSRSARVELDFRIASDGRVRDIAVHEGSTAEILFVRAASQALRQWRFSPASVDAGTNTRYRQDFVFASEAPRTDEDGCVRRTGTRLCSRVGDNHVSARESVDEIRNELADNTSMQPG